MATLNKRAEWTVKHAARISTLPDILTHGRRLSEDVKPPLVIKVTIKRNADDELERDCGD